MAVTLKQFDGATVSPKDDAIMYDQMSTDYGIISGCDVNILSTNIVNVSAGYALIHGRLIQVDDMNINCSLPIAESEGRIFFQLDLQNTLNPIQLLSEATKHDLIQPDNVNFIDGVFEMELATYTATPTAIQSIVKTAPDIKSAMVSDAYDVTYKESNVGAELDEINNNLSANDTPFIFDYQDGKYGYNTSPNRGADTFVPFSGWGDADEIIEYINNPNNTIANKSIIPQLTSENDRGYVIRTSSKYNDGVSGFHAFDKNENTYWMADWSQNQWISVEFPEAIDFEVIAISTVAKALKNFSLQYSDDNSSWETLMTDVMPNIDNTFHAFKIQKNGKHKYYKIVIPDSYDYGSYIAIRELVFI